MRNFANCVLAFCLCMFLTCATASQLFADIINPFDIKNHDNSNSIDKLKCKTLAALIAEKDPQAFVVIVWAHGVASGLNGNPIVFNNESFVGTLAAITYYCQTHENDTVFQSILSLRNHIK